MSTETVPIYFEDLDAMGVVHNGRYVTVFERALAAYWARAGWLRPVPISAELREACEPLLAREEADARDGAASGSIAMALTP